MVPELIVPLIDFFLAKDQSLLVAPFRGNVHLIWMYFEKTGNHSEKALAEFKENIDVLNAVSGTPIVFQDRSRSSIVRIKRANIELLQHRLADGRPLGAWTEPTTPAKPENSAPLENQLLELLEGPIRTVAQSTENASFGFDYDLDRLHEMLARPSAMITLGIRRAQLLSQARPFFEVCEVHEHSQTLANLCLNFKSLGLTFNELPSHSKVHKVLNSCKNLLSKSIAACVKTKIHFLPLITANTDLYLGNCLYLNTCHKLKSCRYLHYFTLNPSPGPSDTEQKTPLLALDYTIGECHDMLLRQVLPAQWINCDVRFLPFSILGKFAAIISDPAWDIHMSLPYGTCKDQELLQLPMRELQDEGILMLWVTGRSIEIGRKALAQWGYTISDEMIWIKLNQLRRTIVTGRTGHWLNHSKEHLLVGVKGNPIWLNRKMDIDFIVSGTRETLRKPNELYDIVERLVGKHARKLEIFGRENNIRPGWMSMFVCLLPHY